LLVANLEACRAILYFGYCSLGVFNRRGRK
jgi:hypothetical protein